ncbi:MAG: UDP-N-acetylglucosamine 1-carboxyvinyltransferase [Candidatus Omnitrophica bacterium CG11_big_fil_rev_8_21_14_0_20_64_10]|nr:MAG: UDP-N-acetylglucosamine 1-carboxyvinyltransferase [Candidatus Omnitrophica bacterium CG11_big_fil_rev_8_21_14_0_20_64_10]
MDKLIVQGTGRLSGEVSVSGSKNASLPILAAPLLTDEPCELRGVPAVRDVATMLRILRHLGVRVAAEGNRIRMQPGGYAGVEAPYRLVSTMRASFCVLGPLLARKKRASVSLPGGCVIGPRPVDLHLKGLTALGAKLKVEQGNVIGTARRLRGTSIYLGGAFGSSVLGTANVLMAAVLTPGETVIESAACEPELADLGDVLVQMGAKIDGHGTPVIRIRGVRRLGGFRHQVIPDRIEAGTFLVAGAILGGELTVRGARAEHLGAVLDKLRQAGVGLTIREGAIRVRRTGRLKPVDVTTLPYPGFPTDLQAQMTALMAQTPGISVITEKIYPERFMHVAELARMGARIKREGTSAIVLGVEKLSGAPVMASDLRASAALVLAALSAKGRSEIARVYHLDRGYDRIDEKFKRLGARITRVKER